MNEQGGFTLVEVLIAIAITAIIIVPIYQSFNIALRTWECRNERSDLEGEIRLLAQLFQRDVESAFLCQFSLDKNFAGDGESIEFISKRSGEGLLKIRYTFSKTDGSLYYSVSPIIENEEKVTILCQDLSRTQIEYYYNGVWLNSWKSSEEACLPKAVRMSLELKDSTNIGFTIPINLN
jgi:prepilin-type N-terminal cleavage/methylation domain-containing protein